MELCTFDYKHENLHIDSFGPAEFKSAGSQSQFLKGTPYLTIQNGRHLKLISQAADAHAGDTYYHLQCYLHLKTLAHAEDRKVSAGPSVLTFNSVAIAQIVGVLG